MKVNGVEYKVVVTSANDFDNLSMECTLGNELLIEAELVSYIDLKATLYFHKTPLPLELVDAFTQEVTKELKYGGYRNDS